MGLPLTPVQVATFICSSRNRFKRACPSDNVWGHTWQGQVVHIHSDNEAVVAVVNSGYSKDLEMMHLVRCLFFVLAAWNISFFACHIAGVLNTVTDAILRDNIPLLFLKVPDADPSPALVPTALVELLVTRQPDSTLPSWGCLFRSCFRLA